MTNDAVSDTTIERVPGTPNLLLGAYDVSTIGYDAVEFFVSGTATSYVPQPGTAAYTTRIVVLTPTDPARFSGTVIVEWLNVSGGIDAPAVWFMAHREIVRAGHAYVAVSAQRVGIEGGASMGMDMSLKTQDAARYGALNHPGDAYAYDIYSQIGRLFRDRADELLNARPETVVAVGESQSALFLTTYVNVVDPLAEVYDGFLVHSRFGPAAPLDGSSIFEDAGEPEPVPFSADLRAPVMTVITETDLVGGVRAGYHLARRPDGDRLRAWEIAGTAHADNYTIKVGFIDSGSAPLADLVAGYAPTTNLMGQELPHCINFGPQHHYVLQAALAHLVAWVRTGAVPPTAARMDLTDDEPTQLVLDANGLATGGVRTPWVDVPIARTSGIGSAEPLMAMLFGSGSVFDAETLARLYPGGAAEYLDRFTTSLDATIEAGFLLAADREEILALAAATFPAP
ncbi:alpha/beta hydrolase domain-containing protein [Mycolicibacterium frederiksbergense]|uniref:alpha/beta hydrolase domain-containing protein n=1 Tax=Mycolicibacterium frederiksbergense TaxID=117567 RepID=UPI001F2FE63A|nr:alpha/beta hydrolase domain-containing protein [Mycolicibacterium frederiksbergense]